MARPAEASLPAAPQASIPVSAPLRSFPWLKGVLLLAGLVGAGLALRLVGVGTLHATPPTALGAAGLVGAGALLTAVGLPRQVVAFAAGLGFGALHGGALALSAQMLGCVADFWWARSVAPTWARRRLGGRIDRLLQRRPFVATLTLRLLPVGNNLLLNLLAGASGIGARAFFLATLIGYLPQTAIFALAGSGVQVGGQVRLAAGACLFAASAILGWVLLRNNGPGPGPKVTLSDQLS